MKNKYSEAECQAMRAAFKGLFAVKDELLDSPAIKQWMEEAPIAIVEYDGRLKGEGNREKDQRMEIVDVYDGNISPLVEHLRRIYREYRKLPKWQLIFKIYNEIMAVQKSIEQAELQVVFGENGDAGKEVPQEKEELQTNPGTSIEEIDMPTTEEIKESQMVEQKEDVSSVSSQEPNVEASTNTESDMPSGNVHETEGMPLFNNNIAENIKEEIKMSETNNAVSELLNAAKSVAPDADPTKVQTPGEDTQVNTTKSNVGKVKDPNAEQAAIDAIGKMEDRNNWVRSNTVTAVIVQMKPAALRVVEEMGSPAKGETDATKAAEIINEKINSFIVAVSGKADMTQEQFEALPDAEKYANVVKSEDTDVDNIGKAAAIYNLYKTIKQNPLNKVGAFIPKGDKINYPARGYEIGSAPYPEQEFILEVAEKSTGAIYGVGSVDVQGNSVGETPTYFKVGVATRKEQNVSKGISTAVAAIKKLIVKPFHKKEFLKDPSHIKYLFDKLDPTNATQNATFKAAIMVNGNPAAATVPVYYLENGQKVARGEVKKDGTVSYKTKVAAINVSVPVYKVVKEFGAQYKAEGEDPVTTANRWGVTWRTETSKGDFGNVKTGSSAPIYDVFQSIYKGEVKLEGKAKNSTAFQKLRAAANTQIEKEAAQSAEALEA